LNFGRACGGRSDFLARVERRLGGFRGVRPGLLRVLLAQLLRSLGCPREVLPDSLLPAPGLHQLWV